MTIDQLEEQLDNFDPNVRADALCELSDCVQSGQMTLPPLKNEVNLHFHTFFSFNAHGWSPSRIAWEARKHGLAVAGIVDFDVLDGIGEFLSAGEILTLRTTAALETRVVVREYAEHVISSPNEPGIAYFMAGGCFELPPPSSRSAEILQYIRNMARRRNVQVMERVNDYLGTVRLDYDTDVLPLTPSGNATERHMLAAYDAKAQKVFGADVSGFWAKALETAPDEASALIADTPKLHEKMRSKLMKFGGVGYVAPAPETFPTVEYVIEMIQGMQALPMATWLDGANSGEADMPAMLRLLESKGVVALNAIPDRNWNIKDPDEKRIKVENLRKVIEAAREIGFPLCVGTEMNKLGLPFVDDFTAPELRPYLGDFLDGAYFLWGHTFMARGAGMGFASDWAHAYLGTDRHMKSEFYTAVGKLAGPGEALSTMLGRDVRSASPRDVIRALGG